MILTKDNNSTSPFPDLSGKLCVWFLWLVSDIIVFLGDRLVFVSDLVIENLEVDLVALHSDAVNYGVVGCNAVLVIIGLEGGYKDCVGLKFLGGYYVLITAVIPDGEAYSDLITSRQIGRAS